MPGAVEGYELIMGLPISEAPQGSPSIIKAAPLSILDPPPPTAKG